LEHHSADGNGGGSGAETVRHDVAREDGKIIGTGRCTRSGADAFIGRLAVRPDCQRKGIASAIVRALEAAHSDAARFEIFTSEKSADNIALYAKLGYREFKRVSGDQGVMVFMEKRR
jgi:predicted N-acetyltransferase YhbS